jgi:DICT domain-containing protein
LIVISRYIERHAWQAGEGTLRTSFQRLSRIDDERGTREMYETLAGTDVRTHVYGIPD